MGAQNPQQLVCVDARTVYSPNPRGTGKNLVDLYARVARGRANLRFVMLHRNAEVPDPFAEIANIENMCVDIPGDRWGFWQNICLPRTARRLKASLLHCPANTAPRFGNIPLLVTIHDLIPLSFASVASQARKWKKNVIRAAGRARKIITPSEFSKSQIVDKLGADSDKVVVNYWAPDGRCKKVTDVGELCRVRKKYALHPDLPYLFGFGAADPRKNTIGTLRAWADLPREIRNTNRLLLVGINDAHRAELFTAARNLGISDSLHLHGFADEADIPALLSGAMGLCFASFSEGFGLPILDAFVCETPVITSNVTSLPEIAGDAAILVDPRDTASITDAMRRIITENNLRNELIARGTQRAENFTWDKCCQRFCAVLDEVLGLPPSENEI